jgi:hypothetical protein
MALAIEKPMKKLALTFLITLSPSILHAQSVNDLVLLFLSQNNITFKDYQTCDPSPTPVISTDGICSWGTDLGPQPTSSQLLSLIPTFQSQQTSAINSTSAQLAYNSQISQGLTITCASNSSICTPAITGTYTVATTFQRPNIDNASAQTNITAIEAAIAAGRGFPGGGTTFNYFDMSGAPHTFTMSAWAEFATAMYNYSYSLQSALITLQHGGSATFPSSTVQLQ